jgi:hypothetical protein
MSKTALLAFNDKSSKWEASYNGQVFLSSASKDYVIDKIINQISNKAKTLGVTRYEELGKATDVLAAHTKSEINFSINERFEFLEDFVEMVATREIASTIIVGEGGLGKTFTVMKTLERLGMEKEDPTLANIEEDEDGTPMVKPKNDKAFVVVKGYSTAKGLFRTLYENKNRIVIFDDCDSVLKDETACNVLKAALDSYDERIVTWNAEAPFGSDLPRSFEFTGGIIFISNQSMHKIPQPIRSRAMPADVSMTRSEIVTRMRAIVDSGTFLPEMDMEIKNEALDFIAENANNPAVKSLNLRTLIGVCKARKVKIENWERRALYAMINT